MPTEAERIMALFTGHGGAHGTHGEPTQVPGALKWQIKSTAKTVRDPVTLSLWEQHLRGERPLGVIPIDESGHCRWGSIDYDVYDGDILAIVERVERAKLPLVPCRSKSGGIHLWLFLRFPTPAAALIIALRDMAAHLGLASEKTDIFPAQQHILTERGDVGNWILMPYAGVLGAPGAGGYGGKLREQYGLKKTGAEMTLGEFIRRGEEAMLDALPPPRATPKQPRGMNGHNHGPAPVGEAPSVDDFSDGPPCLQHMIAHGILDDGRKRALFHMAVYYKRAAQNWEVEIEQANHKWMSPPLPAEEVLGVIRSHKKKDYNYTCKQEPMQGHCDSSICRFRRFGVGDPGDVPHISGLSVLDTEPPIWFVDVGDRRLEIATDDLIQYQRFHKICMDSLFICFTPVKQNEWVMAVRTAMESVIKVAAPPEISDRGKFLEWLSDFCTDRGGGNRREDVLRGIAWHDEEHRRYVFQLKDFEAHLQRQRVDLRALTRGFMTQRIRALGGAHQQIALKPGANRSCWWVPESALVQAEELPVPPRTEEPI